MEPPEQKMLKGKVPRVTFHQVFWYTEIGIFVYPSTKGSMPEDMGFEQIIEDEARHTGPLSSEYGKHKTVKARF